MDDPASSEGTRSGVAHLVGWVRLEVGVVRREDPVGSGSRSLGHGRSLASGSTSNNCAIRASSVARSATARATGSDQSWPDRV